LPAAITALRQATRLDPVDAGAHRALGLALLRSGRLAEATASLELAIALEGEVATAHYHLAVALDRLGMPRSGTTLVEQILSSHPAVAAGGSCVSGSGAACPRGSPKRAI
jgi:uncharacterized protein HemY